MSCAVSIIIFFICYDTTTATVYGSLDFPGTIWVSQYQKSKTNLDLLEQEIVSGSGISWAICKSAPYSR